MISRASATPTPNFPHPFAFASDFGADLAMHPDTAQMRESPARSLPEGESSKHRASLLDRFRTKRGHVSSSLERRPVLGSRHPSSRSTSSTKVPLTPSLPEPSQDAAIEDMFTSLYQDIAVHVRKMYSTKEVHEGASQAAIEHATAGLAIPWPQILSLLGDGKTRLGALVLCIAWTILSRALLLKLGMSNSPGSTFLPPEVVECFQSFSVGKGAVMLGLDEPPQVDLALLSRWKRITATLMHSTYVEDAFSHFDSRTVNIERALNDLDPLLQLYASSEGSNERLEKLRDLLRIGAQFAFSLFGEPCFWRFDWNGLQESDGGSEKDGKDSHVQSSFGDRASVEVHVMPAELVIWPTLVRVMNGDWQPVKCTSQECALGTKVFLADFA